MCPNRIIDDDLLLDSKFTFYKLGFALNVGPKVGAHI